MKHLFPLLFLSIGLFQTSRADVSGAIGQLEKNDITTAKLVIKELDSISLEKENPENKSAGSLSHAIKNAFVAEFNLQRATQNLGIAAQKALQLDQQGFEHLKPNALGSVNQLGSDAKFKSARETRFKAYNLVTEMITKLNNSLDGMCKEGVKAKLSTQDQEILENAADSIRERSLVPAEEAGEKLVQDSKSKTEKSAEEDAAEKENQELQYESKNRNRALRAMQRAMRTEAKSDESRAMKLMMEYAPDTINGFNDYLAAKAARRQRAEEEDLRNRVNQLENKLR